MHWMEGQPAPTAVLDLLACNCARKCELAKCECMKMGLRCTDMCRLVDCDNQDPLSDQCSFSDGDDDEDEY